MEEHSGERGNEGCENMLENTEKVERKHKKRQKKILGDLQEQIKFYFSSPNLQKDRFLRQKIVESDNGCVEIKTIASFNRMKQLSDDISLIVKAMKLCPSVEVIDDKWVKPSQPLPKPSNVDSMTVYVEHLPSHADHNWIKSLFSSCGTVVYVSLPRFPESREIKGFAFVEFEKQSEAEAALKMFAEKKNSEENDQTKDKPPDDNEQAEKQNKKTKKRKAKVSESESDDMKVKSKKAKRRKEGSSSTISDALETSRDEQNKGIRQDIEKEICEESGGNEAQRDSEKDSERSGGDDTLDRSKHKKRKRRRSEMSDDEDTASKRNKESLEGEDVGDISSKRSDCETNALEGDAGEMDGAHKKKKKRKRKKKEKQKVEIPQLRVLSKKDWLTMKNKYLSLQKAAMGEAKEKLRKEKTELASKTTAKTQGHEKDKSFEEESLRGGEKAEGKSIKDSPERLKIQPGVVLKFSCGDKIKNSQIREVFSNIAPVSFLDKDCDSNTGHIRFATKEGCDKVADSFSKTGSLQNITIRKLTETEDTEYCEQINNDRLKIFEQRKKQNSNKRGRQKITKKMDDRNARKQVHIHFED